jgi:hypothetical protein
MGLETGSSRPDDIPPPQHEHRDQHPDRASTQQPDQVDRRDQPPAETRTRGEYARAIRDNSDVRPGENPELVNTRDGTEPRPRDDSTSTQVAGTDTRTDRDRPAEPRTRAEVTRDLHSRSPQDSRETPSAEVTHHVGDRSHPEEHRDGSEERTSHETHTPEHDRLAETSRLHRAEEQADDANAKRTANNEAPARETGHVSPRGAERPEGGPSTGHTHVTHYKAEFRGNRLDLYTDGTRWAGEYHLGDNRRSGTDAGSAPRDGPGLEGRQARPEKVYVDGREVVATHNARDGIWVEGMGEIPDAPVGDPYGTGKTGDVVASGKDKPRAERARSQFFDRYDDISDTVEKVSDEISQIFKRPPASGRADVPTRSGAPDGSGHEHGVDVPDATKALLAAGALTWGAGHLVHETIKRRRAARHGGDE